MMYLSVVGLFKRRYPHLFCPSFCRIMYKEIAVSFNDYATMVIKADGYFISERKRPFVPPCLAARETNDLQKL